MDDIELLLPELWEIIKRNDCVAWIGSGLSVVADYPDWGATVARLCTACGVAPIADAGGAELLLEKAEECKNANVRAYQQTLEQLFGRPPVQTRHAYNLIMTLPFKAYITTNFDPLLAAAGMTHGHTNLYTYPSLPAREIERSAKAIFYLHGLARQNNEGSSPW